MGYVPGFEHDVFISYASRDNPKRERDDAGWVDVFQESLEDEINRGLREAVRASLWRDEEQIDVGDRFPDSIAKGVDSSALLVILLSRQYLASKWCERERRAYLKAVTEDAYGLDGRVFVVCLSNPAELVPAGQELPDGLSVIHQAPFWRDVKKKSQLLGHPVPDRDRSEHQDFFNEIFKVSQAVAEKLDEMRARAKAPAPRRELARPEVAMTRNDEPTAPTGGLASAGIYLAAAQKGTDESRFTKDLLLALTSSIPPVPAVLLEQLPREPDLAPLRETLKASKLFVQVVGYSPPPRDGLQNRLAAELQMPTFIWKQTDIDENDIEDLSDHHRLLIAQARKGTLDEALRAITEQWERLNQPPVPAPKSGERKLFINHLPEDRELGARVFKLLTDRQRLQCVRRPLDGASEAELRAYFERKLLECGDMVLVYGKASRLSVNDQAELCYQMLASRKDLRELAAQWIVISGPPQPPESQVELDVGLPYVGIRTIDGRVDLEGALAAAFPAAGNGARP